MKVSVLVVSHQLTTETPLIRDVLAIEEQELHLVFVQDVDAILLKLKNEIFHIVLVDFECVDFNSKLLIKYIAPIHNIPVIVCNIPAYIHRKDFPKHLVYDLLYQQENHHLVWNKSIQGAVKFWLLTRKKRQVENQLHQVENRLLSIISNVPIFIFVIDYRGVISMGIGKNNQDFKLEGKGIIGKEVHEVFKNYPLFLREYKALASTNESKIKLQIEDKFYELYLLKTKKTADDYEEVIVLAHEITNIVEAQEANEQAVALATKTTKLKEEFIANMSHEVRTPMNAIVGFTELLQDTPLNLEQKEYVEAIKDSGINMLNLLNEILNFSKIASGVYEIYLSDFSPYLVVENLLNTLKSKAIEKKINLYLFANFNEKIMFNGDVGKFLQIVMNLISNAIKFTNKGGVTVELNYKERVKGQIDLITRVKDTGIGIPSEEVNSIFESFIQVSGQDEKIYGGTGLGLSIVKKLTQILDGSISLQSELGKGSIFTLRLPLSASENESKFFEEQGNELVESNFKGIIILSVEDNPMNQKLLNSIFSKQEVTLIQAANGKEALTLLNKYAVDLILMDLQMPVMNGFSCAQHIRELPNNLAKLPIIALSANSEESFMDNAESKCFDAYVNKPITINELFNKITNLLNLQNKLDAQINQPQSYHLTRVSELCGEKTSMIKEMLHLFLSELEDMEMFIKLPNSPDAYLSKLHKLKSAVALFNFTAFTNFCKKMEAQVQGFKPEDLKKYNKQLSKHLKDTIQQVKQLIHGYEA